MQYYQHDKYPIEFVLSENIDKHFAPHNHVKHYVISMVMQEVATVCLENREVACHRGDVFIIPPYTVHSVRQTKDTKLLSMCIGTTFIEEATLEAAEVIVQDLLRDAVERGIIGNEQSEKLLASLRTVYRLRDQGRREMDVGIKALTDKITSHPEQNLPIEALAAEIYVSKYYLIRKFKNCIGMTPHQFCIQNRIRKSQGLLDTERTVGEISAEMGFYDQSHFNKVFQKIVGISPSEYIHSKNIMQQIT
ncbi:MAG: helix-turn-helix transcriptional regulator [Lachnospiraceae bacterium]|nr:helix-turn-helix transcriptional regulator [Lachnospiraceae bacterium]